MIRRIYTPAKRAQVSIGPATCVMGADKKPLAFIGEGARGQEEDSSVLLVRGDLHSLFGTAIEAGDLVLAAP